MEAIWFTLNQNDHLASQNTVWPGKNFCKCASVNSMPSIVNQLINVLRIKVKVI